MHAAVPADIPFALSGVTLVPGRLRGVTLEFSGGVTAVLGWSGAGKTSLLNVLVEFERPHGGEVRGDEGVAWVPQSDGLWPDCTASEHLTECGATREEAARLLAAFDLESCADRCPPRLSRGEQSRLAVARALAMSPRTLVMDEPLSHVDPARAGKYWRAIREHVAHAGTAFIFATHSPEVALGEASQAICLREGTVVFQGAISALYNAPATEELANLLGPTNWITPGEASEWLGETWSEPRSVRPEQLSLQAAEGGPEVQSSRFRGAYAETELRDAGGNTRVFLHRPAAPPAPGSRVHIALLLAMLVLVFAGCSSHDAEPTINVKNWHTWVLPTDGATQPTPRSMAVGPKDELAVMDTAGRILIYDANGALLRQWKMLDVQFGKPEGIVWLKDNRLVVCDTHYHRLVWFDGDGKVLRTVGQLGEGKAEFKFPVGITKDDKENLYVCEYGGHDRVQVFSREGEWLREMGSFGPGVGQFQRPSGLVWHAGRVYVADAVNHRVLIFKETGEYEGLLGASANSGSALAFNLPYDITLGGDGAFYIIEYGAGRLTKVSLDGRLLGRYGQTGTGTGEFATPWGLIMDSRLRVYVADTKNRRIVALQL
jgi:ABC-type multidrug transport system ATPase subunit/sugar lactone lactonase YvrE